jgi:hypothetical protein
MVIQDGMTRITMDIHHHITIHLSIIHIILIMDIMEVIILLKHTEQGT